jgi:hypothetical protein
MTKKKICTICGQPCPTGGRGDELPLQGLDKTWHHFGCWRSKRPKADDPWGIDEHTPQERSADADKTAAAENAKRRAKEQQPELLITGSSWAGEDY